MYKNLSSTLGIGLLFWLLTACLNNNSAPPSTAEQKEKSLLSDEETSLPQSPGSLEKVEETDLDGNVLNFTRRKKDSLREGLFIKTNKKGLKLEQANYRNGKLEGYRVLFHPNGDTMIVETRRNDLFEGEYKSFYLSGQLKMTCQYLNNNIEGAWLQYYETGQLKEEVLFVNNEENGPFKEYHLNGQLSVEGAYKDGANEHGPLKFYDEQGVHNKTMECKMGVCRTIWKLENEKGSKSKKSKRQK